MFQIGNHIHHYLTGNWGSSTILTIVGLMLKSSLDPIPLIMVIEQSGVQFGLKSYA